jgi:hypothetical protein
MNSDFLAGPMGAGLFSYHQMGPAYANANANFSANGLSMGYGGGVQLGSLLGVNYSRQDRSNAIQADIESPFAKVSFVKQDGLSDIIRASWGDKVVDSGISQQVAKGLSGYIQYEKDKRSQYSAMFGYQGDNLSLTSYINGIGTKKVNAGINFGGTYTY